MHIRHVILLEFQNDIKKNSREKAKKIFSVYDPVVITES